MAWNYKNCVNVVIRYKSYETASQEISLQIITINKCILYTIII